MLASWTLLAAAYPAAVPPPWTAILFLAREGARRIVFETLLTLTRTLAGFAAALAAAVLAGYIYTMSSLAASVVKAFNTLLQSISVLVWIVVLVMLFGVLNPLPPVLVAALVALPIILSSLVAGLETANPRLLELAAMLGAPRRRVYWDFLLPSLLPQLAGASRAALGAALRISVVAEVFGGGGGIGYMIGYYYELSVPEGVFAWATLLVTLMVTLDQLVLKRVEEAVKRWATLPAR